MKRFIVAGALTATSFGFSSSSEAFASEQLPVGCSVAAVGKPVNPQAEQALVNAGFLEITVDGSISSSTEQISVLRAQQTLKDVGALAESVQICGIAGLKTKQAAELVVSAGGLASDKQAVPTDNELAHCNVDPQVIKSIGDKDVFLEKGEIISIQAALRAAGIIPMIIDGKYGDQTKKGIKSFQKKNGLKADCILGPATAKKMKLSQVASANFNPKGDCPKPSSCDVLADLTSQRLKIINGAGITIWEIPIQSGKLGKETRTVVGKLGAVEYGPNNNPERPSVDYPEAILVNPRAFGGGKQKFHGSYSFNPDAIINPKNGSAGCIRISISDSYILAGMPTGTDVVVTGAKPGTTQR